MTQRKCLGILLFLSFIFVGLQEVKAQTVSVDDTGFSAQKFSGFIVK